MHGFFLVNKPVGITSTDVVRKLKRLMPRKHKIGHGGTLDPLADGLLPIAVGEATKLISYVMDAPKTYEFTVQFGEKRTTGDAEGKVIATSDIFPDAAAINAVIPPFLGEIQQRPPAYSAIKIDGKRAYDLARAGEVVELPPRPITIHALSLLHMTKSTATLRATCSKGTYIRVLAEELACAAGSVGYVSMLRRTRIGKFCLDAATALDDFLLENQRKDVYTPASGSERAQSLPHPAQWLMPAASALDDIPVVESSPEQEHHLRNGRPIVLSANMSEIALQATTPVAVVDYAEKDRLIAIAKVVTASDGSATLQPVRVFNIARKSA